MPVFGKKDVRVDLVDTAAEPKPAREDKPERAAKPKRSPKPDTDAEAAAEEKPKRARKKRDDDEAPREKPARKARAKSEGRQQRGDDGGSVPAGDWNGPRPGFLDISAT